MKRNKITLLLAAFLLVCGCSDFEEINVNPNNPPTVPANLLLPTVISTAVSSMTQKLPAGSQVGRRCFHAETESGRTGPRDQ